MASTRLPFITRYDNDYRGKLVYSLFICSSYVLYSSMVLRHVLRNH